MINAADKNGDGVIDYQEFNDAYDSIGWKKTKNISQVMSEMQATWSCFDTGDDGQVGIDEILKTFKGMGINISKREAEKMLKDADEDYDGSISHQEFIVAYHSSGFKTMRQLGMVNRCIDALQEEQSLLFKADP